MKYLKLFLALLWVATVAVGYSQIGIQTNSPDASSALDIVSTNKGLLVPRVTLTVNLGSPSPVTAPATGLLVFNTGANQPLGFYYWDGTTWIAVSSGGGTGTAWELTGNSGTTVGTNFLGTTDAEALALYTNDTERMRILDDGRITIENGYNPPGSDDKFTVRADATHNDAISGTSSVGYGIYGYSGTTYALYGNSNGVISVRARSQHATGTGILATGNNVSGSYPTTGSGGAFTGGDYGSYSKALNSDGNGVAGAGNGEIITTLGTGSGGAFRGTKYGTYTKAANVSNGNGIAGVGNGGTTAYVPPGGSGGSFTADSIGVYGKGLGSVGNGVVGRGTGGSTYHYPTAGSGGSFTGDVGVYGYSDITDGHGIVGVVMGETYSTPGGGGTGGSFTGPFGIYAKSSDTDGTGIIGVGNDGSNYHTMPDGSGGSFSGYHGVYGVAENSSSGIGVVGLGNDASTRYTRGNGGGGSFTGASTGVEGFATNASTSTYGVYGKFESTAVVNGVGVYGYSVPKSNRGYGVVGEGGNLGVLSINAFGTTGYMVRKTDHPLDPKNKILNHYAIESPEVLNMYRGNVNLDANGEATVLLPNYFNAVNMNFSYALTPIGQQAPNLFVKQEIDADGNFAISGGIPNQKISWVVYAERNDLYMQRERLEKGELVEVEKEPENKGKYLTPELYNEPAEKGIFYSASNSEKKTIKANQSKSNKSAKQKDQGEREVKAEELKMIIEDEDE